VDGLVLARARPLAEAAEVARHAEESFAAVLDPAGDDEVLAHGELGEQLHTLKGAGEAAARPRLRAAVGDIDAVHLHSARPGADEPRQHAEQRRLPGAVRA